MARTKQEKTTELIPSTVPTSAASFAGVGANLFEPVRNALAPLIEARFENIKVILRVRELREDVRLEIANAMVLCIAWNNLDPAPKRYSDIRKELLRVSDRAARAAAALRSAQSALNELTARYGELLAQEWGARGDVAHAVASRDVLPWLEAVSPLAKRFADALAGADSGGRPRFEAFTLLVEGLARAFAAATNRRAKVSWSDYQQRHGGRFLEFVESMLPLARELSRQVGKPLEHPASPPARAAYIYDLTRKGRVEATRPRKHS